MRFVPPFTHWLKQQRKALGLTQAELAQRAHYATVTLRKIEENRLKPSREMALQLADALEVPVEAREDFVVFARGKDAGRSLRVLPAPAAPIISRQAEVQETSALLLRSDVRLVTLTGSPGVGKTRLAIEIGARLADQFADGVCFVPLTEVRRASDVAPAIASTLGVLVSPHIGAAQTLAHSLQPLELLLILDNFEHVLDAANLVSELLTAAPELTVLVTSRAPLNLNAEHRCEVLPLDVPAEDGDLETLAACPSVQLFAQRAQLVKPSFALTPENLKPVAEVCSHLEGLPLAIELAAGRATMYPPRTLASRLRAHSATVLAMSAAGMPDAPSHHKTLRATITWSYQLLDAEAQRIFRSLGVFVGGFSLAAAEVVCAGLPVDASDPLLITSGDDEFLRHFETLLNHSLIRPADGGAEEDPRFDMLETLREFALEQLVLNGEETLTRERHAAYFAQLANAMFFGRPSREDAMWLRRLRAERANVHTALAWRMVHDDNIEQELLLSAVVNHAAWVGGLMWGMNASSAGAEDWLNRVELMALSYGNASPESRAKALHGLVERAIYEGDEARIDRLHRLVERLYRETNVPRLMVLGLYSRAFLAQRRGDVLEGLDFFRQARELAHRHGLRDSEANALGAQGDLLLSQGDDHEAEACLTEAVAIHREMDLEWCLGVPLPQCLRLLAFIAQARGDYEAALGVLAEAHRLFNKHGDNSGVMACLVLKGRVYWKQGRHVEALDMLRPAASRCMHWSRDWLAVVLALMAGVKLAMSDVDAAARLAGAASRHEKLMQSLRHPRIQLCDDYERILRDVRRSLNSKTHIAWDEGAALSDADAVSLAVRV